MEHGLVLLGRRLLGGQAALRALLRLL